MKIDWDRIKTEYITGRESITAISKRYKVSRNEVGVRCAREGWVAKRKEFSDKTVTNAVHRISRTREEEIVATMQLADLIDAAVRELLDDPERLDRLMSTRQPGKELDAMSSAIRGNDELRRMCRGIMNPRDQERAKLDRERFEYEKKKTEREAEADQTIKVVLEGDTERWSN